MDILIACEYSGIVREEFRKKGWNAMSCDLLPTEIPGNHYQGDVRDVLYEGWDVMIAFPPCTYLTVSGNRHIPNNPVRWQKRFEALKFVHLLMNAPIKHKGLENPVGVISTYIRKPDQIIHPYFFGDPWPKRTCLWLDNLPKLVPTDIVEPQYVEYNSKKTKSGKSRYGQYGNLSSRARPEVALLRSKTYPGIARAMAEQWTEYINELYLL